MEVKTPNKDLYSQFLLSTQGRYSMVWLSHLLDNQPAHDSWTRWLNTTKLRPSILWEEVHELVDQSTGYLIVDDSVIDKWYAKAMDLVKFQYSGTHHRQVDGINVVSLLWTQSLDPERDPAEHIPIDFRIYAPDYDGKDKHCHAQDMLESAFHRGFENQTVVMDAWYDNTKTMKLIDGMDWNFVNAIKSSRLISPKPKHYESVADYATLSGRLGWMKKYGQVKVFKRVRRKPDDIEYLATNDLSLSAPVARDACKCRWRIEEYHRGTKQLTGLENCRFQSQRAQRNHILCSIRALLALEKWRLDRGIAWEEAKQQLVAEALAHYLKDPHIPLAKATT
jgi:hypothetical protein